MGQEHLLGWESTRALWNHKATQILGSCTRCSTSQSSKKSQRGGVLPGVGCLCKLRSPSPSLQLDSDETMFPSVQADIWVVWVSTDFGQPKTSSLTGHLSIQLRIRVFRCALVIRVQKARCCPVSLLYRVGCSPSVSFWPH